MTLHAVVCLPLASSSFSSSTSRSAPPSALVAKWLELHFSCVNFGPRRGLASTGLAWPGLAWTIRHMCHGAMSESSLKEIRLNCQLSAILWPSNWFPATPNEAHQCSSSSRSSITRRIIQIKNEKKRKTQIKSTNPKRKTLLAFSCDGGHRLLLGMLLLLLCVCI